MQQHKILTWTLLIFSIIRFALAAPVTASPPSGPGPSQSSQKVDPPPPSAPPPSQDSTDSSQRVRLFLSPPPPDPALGSTKSSQRVRIFLSPPPSTDSSQRVRIFLGRPPKRPSNLALEPTDLPQKVRILSGSHPLPQRVLPSLASSDSTDRSQRVPPNSKLPSHPGPSDQSSPLQSPWADPETHPLVNPAESLLAEFWDNLLKSKIKRRMSGSDAVTSEQEDPR